MKYLGCILLCGLALGVFANERPRVRFGVLTDGPSPQIEHELLELIQQELGTLLASDFQVVFDPSKQLRADYSLAQISASLDALLADPDVDVVLCFGVLATMEAAKRTSFAKPVFAPFGIDSTLPLYPRQGEGSGVHNFSYMVTPSSVPRDVALMRHIGAGERIDLIVQDLFASQIPELRGYVEQVFAKEGLKVNFVLANQTAAAVLAALPADAKMVYVTPLIRFEPSEKIALFAGLAERRLPSVSLLGREEVELGVLAGLAPKSDRLRWLRRLALNIQRALLGEDPAVLPVLLKENSKLVFNMETARKIGWYPSWDLQITADLIGEALDSGEHRLDLETAVRKALAANPELAAAERELRAAEERIALARANLLPKLDSTVTGTVVDEDTAAASFGLQPETSTQGELVLTQVLYSDAARAGVAIQRQLFVAQGHAFQTTRLDLALQVAEAYFSFLEARSLAQVRRENLERTNSHLETARARQSVGIASAAEVYRWEAQLANDKLDAISANNTADQARYALNRLIGESQERSVGAEVPDMMDARMRTGFGRLAQYVDNAHDFQRFRDFMVQEALRDAPELAQIEALVAAQRRKLQADTRAFYLPTVSARGALKHQIQRSDAENPLADMLPPGAASALPQPPDTGWNAALQFTLPLSTGGKRKQERRIDALDLEHLELRRQSAREQIELRVRAGLQALATTVVGMQLRREAAEAAGKNLAILEDGYAKGVASPIDLIDGQNAALVSQIAAANAVHEYFIALMRFQRASGNFDFFIDPTQREAFYQRLDQYYRTE